MINPWLRNLFCVRNSVGLEELKETLTFRVFYLKSICQMWVNLPDDQGCQMWPDLPDDQDYQMWLILGIWDNFRKY
ncbi:hypothetical protein CEXT_524001 [Caerostris extrusa]|uniref:Uncharacterized protein n=1 Tax=Caerostris extrusa TaxID=172846 RepID=A0AAV4P8A5_CAEEX|nr:hypothetical protein CEXT_524001 [Caerostris extrusa]